MQWHASARVRSRFEFHVVHSNQGTTMTTDKKKDLNFFTSHTEIINKANKNRVL